MNDSRILATASRRRSRPQPYTQWALAQWALAQWVLALALGLATVTSALGGPLSAGKRIDDFQLQDAQGHVHRLSDYSEAQVVIVAFLGTECPLARLYGPRLQRLADQYASDRSVQLVGINSNSQDSLAEIAAYAQNYGLNFPMLKDIGNQVSDQFKATRTPEVFVLDARRRVRYSGRIDDQYGVGYLRDKPERKDLEIAVKQLLAGEEVEQPKTEAVGCLIGRDRTENPQAKVTYASHIASLLQRRCVECHRAGEIAPFALTDFDEISGWADMIAEVVREERMPPWHAAEGHLPLSNDRRLSADEKRLIETWVADGAPMGDPDSVPEIPKYLSGWQLPREPDLVVNMAETPFDVPAEGAVSYKYFRVDPGIKEDRWIQALEVVPGNRSVVHHVLVFAKPPEGVDGDDYQGGVRGFLGGFVPGMRAMPYPDGMAKFLPADSQLIFQMHYTPNGKPQEDLSKIGFVFADRDTVDYEVKTVSAFQPGIRIPKRAAEHVETTKTKLYEDALLLAFMPHMHVRGRSFRYELKRPGDEQWSTLLDVPAYDFNWQTRYDIAGSFPIPADSYVKCTAVYDNSAGNLNNPNPNKTVTWGEQTWEEMLIGYFDVAFSIEGHDRRVVQLDATRRAEEFILQMDKNDDYVMQVTELPWRMRLLSGKADVDRDGVITAEELAKAFRKRRRR